VSPPLAQLEARPRPAPGSRVPAEFVGRARLLRGRIASAHRAWLDGAVDLAAPLMPRDDFTPTFTKQSLSVTAARWKSLPEWGRLGVGAEIGRDRVQLAETRLAPFKMVMADWDEPELSIAVVLVSVQMRVPTTFTDTVRVLGVVGLHGIARRFERGSDRSEREVLRDFMSIPVPPTNSTPAPSSARRIFSSARTETGGMPFAASQRRDRARGDPCHAWARAALTQKESD
jgi:hypothetical protein